MKKLALFIFTISFLALSCRNDSLEQNILGSWSGCLSEAQYSEIHFFDDVLFNFFPNDDSPQIRRYSIEGDSLFIHEYIESNEKKFIYRIKFNSVDKLVLSDSLNLIHLQRLPKSDEIKISISKKPKLLSEYLEKLSARSQSHCD